MNNREIKFRIWDKNKSKMLYEVEKTYDWEMMPLDGESNGYSALMQYTGLKDKNGVEIWELMELNGKYRVVYEAPSYVLQDISSGDIIPMYEQNKREITKEYSPLS